MPSDQAAFAEAFNAAMRDIGCVNLAVFGKTGVGKSTLVNSFFGTDIAATGVGRPVTEGLHYYKVPNRPFGLYDSQGFEVGESAENILAKMRSIVAEKRAAGLSEQIHAIWYCVRSSDRRFETSQADFVRELLALSVPVIIVMTQVPKRDDLLDPEAEALADHIRSEFAEDSRRPAALVMTNAKTNHFLGVPEHGLEELLDRTSEIVPEALRNALTAAQQVDLDRKRSAAQKIVGVAAASAAAAAAVPIPFVDLGMLLPVEGAMFAKISTIYGLPMSPGLATKLATTAVLGQGARAVGTQLMEGLLKVIPGVNIAVGVANAGFASAMTLAAGAAWMVVCEHQLRQANASQVMDSDQVTALFRDAFKKRVKVSGQLQTT